MALAEDTIGNYGLDHNARVINRKLFIDLPTITIAATTATATIT